MKIVEIVGYTVVGISVGIFLVAVALAALIFIFGANLGPGFAWLTAIGGIIGVIGIAFGMVGSMAAGMTLIATVRFLELADLWKRERNSTSGKPEGLADLWKREMMPGEDTRLRNSTSGKPEERRVWRW